MAYDDAYETSIIPLNPVLYELAARAVQHREMLEKSANPGAPPAPAPAPAGGGASPPDPSGGGLPPPDPAMMQQIMQVMQQMGVSPGGAGGPAGAGGGKKAEQQLLDTKLWIIQRLVVKMCQKMGVQLDPGDIVGSQPDPMAMAAVQQEGQQTQGAGAPAPSQQQGMGGAVPPPQPIQPMDASQGPIGKAAAYFDTLDLAPPIDPIGSWTLADNNALLAESRERQGTAARISSLFRQGS